MDRVFLDANVLFSASFRESNDLLQLWQLQDIEVITSLYAMNEAQRNITSDAQFDRLNRLRLVIQSPIWIQDYLPKDISLATKDVPILLDAINAQASHLLTGDKRHFGKFYGETLSGVLIQRPADYLSSRNALGERRVD